jgi:hypothetical protein
MTSFKIKAIVQLEIEDIIPDCKDHDEAKRKLQEKLIREGYSFLRYIHAKTEKINEETIDIHTNNGFYYMYYTNSS